MSTVEMTKLQETVLYALAEVQIRFEALGEQGCVLVQKEHNQFREMATLMDIEAEQTVIGALRKAQIPARIISEEHGIVVIGDPCYTVVLDGLDGSDVYRRSGRKARCGTMVAVFRGLQPRYDDYLFAAITDYATRRVIFCRHGEGAYRHEQGDSVAPVYASRWWQLSEWANVYVSRVWYPEIPFLEEAVAPFNVTCMDSTAVHYFDLALGEVDLVLEPTRKHNLELAVAYGVCREVGAHFLDLEGNSIGQYSYLDFAQRPCDRRLIVAAGTERLARSFVEYINGVAARRSH